MRDKDAKILYYENELEDEFSQAVINPKRIDGSYKYLGGPLRPFLRGVLYHVIAKPLAYIFLKLKYGYRIINRQCLREAKDSGCFVYGNHTNAIADALIPSMLTHPKGAYVIVHPSNVSMPVLGKLTPALGALPLPDDKVASRNFTFSLDKLMRRKSCIAIYPEAHIWPYYTGIRSYKDASFRYPVKYQVPVYAFTNTYQRRKFRKTPRIVTYVDGPFYPNTSLSIKEQRMKLHQQVIQSMRKYCKKSNMELIKYVKRED